MANDSIPVHGLSPALNYGQQCYEGLKAFRTVSNKITIFRPEFHAARMARSAASICLPSPPANLFLECVSKAVAANAELVPPTDSGAYLYIRPVLFGASASIALGAGEDTILAVFILPIRPYHGSSAIDGVVLEDFDRAAPRGMGAFKVGGNYAPVWRHATRAQKMGFGITLHLDSAQRTYVEEFSTSGFLGHRYLDIGGAQRHVLVVPQSENAIASTTSDSMIQLARRMGWTVETSPLRWSSLTDLNEVVAVGTAAAVVPVRSLSRLSTEERFEFASVPDSLLGLARQMADIQRGRLHDRDGWCYAVFDSPKDLVKAPDTIMGKNLEDLCNVDRGKDVYVLS